MNKKSLTYFQFKKIASTLDSNATSPEEIANVAGLTDVDYDLLYEYLTKWHAEKNIETTSDIPDENIKEPAETEDFGALNKKSLLALFRSTLESSNDGIIIIDNNGKLIDWNDKFFDIAGIPKDALEEGSEEVGLEYIFNQVKDPQQLMIELGRLEEENSMKGDFGEVEFIDGRTIERYTQPLILDNKNVGRVWCFKDITQEKAQRERVNILTSAIQSATQGIIVLDGDSVVYMNDYFQKTIELPSFDVNHNKILEINNDRLNTIYKKICQQVDSGDPDKLLKDQRQIKLCEDDLNEVNCRWYELSTFKSHYNDEMYTLGIISDISESKKLQDQLTYNAYHDLLTGLANRNKLLKVIREKMLNKQNFSVYFMDLDNFKLINDTLGHHNGDIVLKKIGHKLQEIPGVNHQVARMGGDEFVILIDNIKTKDEHNMYIDKIHDMLSSPIKVKDYEFTINYSLGIASYPLDASTPIDLIKNADSAMYQKKMNGKNGAAFYDATIREDNIRKVTIANKIYKAIENNELSIHYQPIYDLKTNRIASLEALLRWNNQDLGGFVNPEEFIAVTEEIGYIDTITYWVFENGISQLKRWHAKGYDKLRLTLNLSGALLYNPKMIANINTIIKSANIDPGYITVELTENVFVNDGIDIISMLKQMSNMGLKIAMDDFGTGYSSFAYLHRLPIDVIKVDKMFTQSLFEEHSRENTAIVLSIIELGRYAGYDIVAEGVETINQMNFLKEHNCKYGQGYHFSRPVAYADMEKLLYEDSLKNKP